MSLLRKLLYSLMVISGLASTVSAGTYASFNATTTTTSTFASGSLVLDRDVAGTSCFSIGLDSDTDINATTGCAVVISENRVKIGDSFTVDLTLTNAGTVDAGSLTFGATATCTAGANPGVFWTAGTGDMCTNTAWVLQEWTTDFGSALVSCAYPENAVAGCSFTTPATLTANASPPSPASGATPGLPLISSPQDLGTLAAGESRYFRMTFNLPTGVDNQLQGRRATFALTWQLDQ